MASIFADFAGSTGSGNRYFLSEHLDNPIIYDGIKQNINAAVSGNQVSGTAYLLRETINLAKRSYKRDYLVERMTPSQALWLLNSVSASDPYLIKSSAVSDRCIDFANLSLPRASASFPHMLNLDDEASHWFGVEHAFSSVVDLLSARMARGTHRGIIATVGSGGLKKIYLDRTHLLVVSDHYSLILVAPYDQFLAMKDCAGSRARVFLSIPYKSQSLALKGLVMEQIKWQELWISLFGNRGYDLAKLTEALAKSALTALTDPLLAENGPLQKMVEKTKAKYRKWTSGDSELEAICDKHLADYIGLLLSAKIDDVVELFGLQKLIMHPHIYVEDGGRSAAKEALDSIIIDYEVIEEIRACWCSEFVLGYIEQHRRWPKLFFNQAGKNTMLYKRYCAGYTGLLLSHFTLSDWKHVRFGKAFDFDYHKNYLDLIEDRSISNYRDEVSTFWDKNTQSTSNRRLLLELMSRESFDIKQVCDIVATRSVPDRWKIVSLYPKERELKVSARMFSMMVMEMRTFFTCLESNIAESIFPYLSSQTMTKDKVDTSHRFFDLTSPSKTTGSEILFLECDLSRWNLRWRGSIIHRIGTDLDDLFGVCNLFNYVHTFFNESMIVVRTSAMRPPGIELLNPPTSDLLWYGHQGGFEGIAQKTWTIATYAMIDRIMINQPGSYRLVGQGDNQVLSYIYPSSDLLSQQDHLLLTIDRLTRDLEVGCSETGQELKPDECIESRTCITYSKRIYLEGREKFLSLKYHSRLFAKTSEEIPSLTADLNGLWSGCLSAAEESTSPLSTAPIAYFLLAREISRRINRDHPEWDHVGKIDQRSINRWTSDDIAFLLTVPSSLGGIIPANPYRFFYHGGGDPLGLDITFVCRLAHSSKRHAGLLTALRSSHYYDASIHPRQLLEQPESLPIDSFNSVGSAVNRRAKGYLQGVVKNTDIASLYSDKSTAYDDMLVTTLLLSSPLNPIVMSDILSSSATAETGRLSKMFTSTRTIQTASRAAGYDASSEIILGSGEMFWKLSSRLLMQSLGLNPIEINPRAICRMIDSMRARWSANFKKAELFVPEIIGLTSVNPFMFEVELHSSPSLSSAIKICGFFSGSSYDQRGIEQPYFGAKTSGNRSEYGFKLVGNSRPIDAVTRLGSIFSLPNTSPELGQLLRQIARHRAPVDLATQRLQSSYIGGSVQHRYTSSRRQAGAYSLGSGNLSSHCFFVTDEIEGVSGSSKDFAIMFQEFFAFGLSVLLAHTRDSSRQLRYIELSIPMSSDDLPVISPFEINLPLLPILSPERRWSNNSLIYDRDVKTIILAGPIGADKLVLEKEPEKFDSDDLVRESIRAILDSSVSLGRDTSYYNSSRRTKRTVLRMDLSEILGASVGGIIDAASVGVINHSLLLWISEMILDDSRTNLPLHIERISRSYAETIESIYEYSAVASDASVDTIRPDSAYRHRSDYPDVVALISAEIRARSKRLLNQSPSRFPITILSKTEKGGITSHYCISRLAHFIFAACQSQEDYDSAITVIRGGALMQLGLIAEEARRIRVIFRWASKCTVAGDVSFTMRQALRDFTLHHGVNIVLADHRQLIRHARIRHRVFRSPDQSTSPLVRIAPKPSGIENQITVHLHAQSAAQSSLARNLLEYLQTGNIRTGRFYSRWVHAMEGKVVKTVYVIGVGNGVAALAALDLGAKSVIGCDIMSEYNSKRIRSDYPPPAVAISDRSNRFKWSSYLFQYAIPTINSVSQFLSNETFPSDAVVCIDLIPCPSATDWKQIVESIRSPLTLICRTRGDIDELVSSVLVISSVGTLSSAVCYRRFDLSEAVASVNIDTLFRLPARATRSEVRSLLMKFTPLPHVISLSSDLEDQMLKRSCVAWFERVPSDLSLKEIIAEIEDEQADNISHDRYARWSRKLHMLWAAHVFLGHVSVNRLCNDICVAGNTLFSVGHTREITILSLPRFLSSHLQSFLILYLHFRR